MNDTPATQAGRDLLTKLDAAEARRQQEQEATLGNPAATPTLVGAYHEAARDAILAIEREASASAGALLNITKAAAHMGLCSQTGHEHLMRDAQHVLAAAPAEPVAMPDGWRAQDYAKPPAPPAEPRWPDDEQAVEDLALVEYSHDIGIDFTDPPVPMSTLNPDGWYVERARAILARLRHP